MAWLKNKHQSIEEVLKKYFVFRNETFSLEPLSAILESLKHENFEKVLHFLKSNPSISENLSHYIHNVFNKKPFVFSLTEADILSENAFMREFRKRFLNSILPPVENENTVWYIVDHVSVRPSKDLDYFQNVSSELLDEFFKVLKIDNFIEKHSVKSDMLFSMNILAWRAAGTALDADVLKMVPEYRNYDNPFLALQDEFEGVNNLFSDNTNFFLNAKDERYKQIKVYLAQCLEFVDAAFKNSSKYGISGKINQSLLKIRQQIIRISEILELFVIEKPEDVLQNSKQLFFNILNYKSRKNNLSELADDSTRLLSHLITNHTAETGTQYITSSYKEYVKMFWKASGGGVIVGALCVLKMLYSYVPGSDFLHALLYSFNYSMGFIMIFLMGFTLATKQPAMTAATMAKVLSEEVNTKENYRDFAHLVSKLFRSQFIAFVGNVLWSFPTSLAIIYGLDVLLNNNLVVPDKADHLLKDLDPIHSKAILHASIAGVYLFISGIIAGNVGNNSVFYQIPKRIAKNTSISRLFGKRFARNLSIFYSKNWAGIVSNFWFGVFLGATGPIGKFLGIDIDIRHITFAAGNLALGLYGKNFSVTQTVFWVSFATVFIIGFFNFLVSFGLSMVLAFRSRKVTITEIKEIIKEIFRYFFRNPLVFFFPIRSFLDVRAKEMMENTVSTKPGVQ